MSDQIVPARGRGCSDPAVRQSRGLAAGLPKQGDARRVCKTFVRTAGIAREKVTRGNLLQILTAGDDVEDEDEDIGDAEAIDDCDP
jgi:hypothetical protein